MKRFMLSLVLLGLAAPAAFAGMTEADVQAQFGLSDEEMDQVRDKAAEMIDNSRDDVARRIDDALEFYKAMMRRGEDPVDEDGQPVDLSDLAQDLEMVNDGADYSELRTVVAQRAAELGIQDQAGEALGRFGRLRRGAARWMRAGWEHLKRHRKKYMAGAAALGTAAYVEQYGLRTPGGRRVPRFMRGKQLIEEAPVHRGMRYAGEKAAGFEPRFVGRARGAVAGAARGGAGMVGRGVRWTGQKVADIPGVRGAGEWARWGAEKGYGAGPRQAVGYVGMGAGAVAGGIGAGLGAIGAGMARLGGRIGLFIHPDFDKAKDELNQVLDDAKDEALSALQEEHSQRDGEFSVKYQLDGGVWKDASTGGPADKDAVTKAQKELEDLSARIQKATNPKETLNAYFKAHPDFYELDNDDEIIEKAWGLGLEVPGRERPEGGGGEEEEEGDE